MKRSDMVRIIGRGWRQLYRIIVTNGKKCVHMGHYYFVITQMENRPLRDPESPAYYAVQLRCGWGPEHVPNLGGMVGGLTFEQWLFINKSRPKMDAILAVGSNWPGLEEAVKRARAKGVQVLI